MALSLKSLIVESDILAINPPPGGKGHPVYLVEGWKIGEGLCIKLESSTASKSNIKSNAMIMHAVSPGATAVVLKPSEIQALKAWCNAAQEDEGATSLLHDLSTDAV